ncbi:hypothetical protein F5883DRAFT_435624, partial [Diaporthe sp. PMI_573]
LLHDCYKWILGNANFQRWQNDQSQLFWIRGDAGKGKTMLLSGVPPWQHSSSQKLPEAFRWSQRSGNRPRTETWLLRLPNARGHLFPSFWESLTSGLEDLILRYYCDGGEFS